MSEFGFEEFSKDLTVPPPLPRHLSPRLAEGVGAEVRREWLTSLRSGCYYLSCELYEPQEPDAVVAYLGTLRLEVEAASVLASGDLYVAREDRKPSPSMGIPIFPIEDYRTYLRIEQVVLEAGGDAQFTVATYAFDNRSWWRRKKTWQVCLRRVHGPINYPSRSSYFQGEILDEYGSGMGTVCMGWVSPMFRRASLQLETIGEIPPLPWGIRPGIEENEVTWKNVFAAVGWDLHVINSHNTEVELVNPGSPGRPDDSCFSLGNKRWTTEALHQELMNLRAEEGDEGLLDREWRYYLLCIDQYRKQTYRGIMFDTDFNLGNKLPREGAAIAAGFKFSKDAGWGELGDRELCRFPDLYFRTALHELGHAMGMVHQVEASGDLGLMTTLDDIKAILAREQHRGESNDGAKETVELSTARLRRALQWGFAPKDSVRLRHFPDYVVRPGGQPFAGQVWRLSSRLPIPNPANEVSLVGPSIKETSEDETLALQVVPHPKGRVLPLGAPIRLELTVRNKTDRPITIPSLKLTHDHLAITVRGPAGIERRIQPLVHVTSKSESEEERLDPEKEQGHGLTLAWGDQEYLFPGPGQYQVKVRWLRVGAGRKPYLLTAATTVLVRDLVESFEDGEVVRELMGNPDILRILAFGGTHYEGSRAEEVLEDALKIKELAPHYRYIVLEHRLRSGQSIKKALKGLKPDEGIILTTAELDRLDERLLKQDETIQGSPKKKNPKKLKKEIMTFLKAMAS